MKFVTVFTLVIAVIAVHCAPVDDDGNLFIKKILKKNPVSEFLHFIQKNFCYV